MQTKDEYLAKLKTQLADAYPRVFEANREVIRDRIFPGQKIRIPI